MSSRCTHEGIGLPGCTTCDPTTGPRAGASLRDPPGVEDYSRLLRSLEESKRPPSTAYDQAQAELRGSIAEIEGRLNAALRRVEALELEVARLSSARYATLPIDPAHERVVEDAIRIAREFGPKQKLPRRLTLSDRASTPIEPGPIHPDIEDEVGRRREP